MAVEDADEKNGAETLSSVGESLAVGSAPPVRTGGAAFIACGILISRILGVCRETAFAHYFGNSSAADAFKAAIRIPNVLQNLLGEGVLSASFIPVYAGLLAKGKEKEASDLAAIILGLLCFAVTVVVALGILCSPYLVQIIAPGFTEDKRDLTITLTRIFFPGTGILVLSAWCLGVLNSHRRFFLPYAAPVCWNLVIILSLVWFGASREQDDLAVLISWSVILGGLAQFFVQLPVVYRLLGGIRVSLAIHAEAAREVLKNFFPVLLSRGVVQVSAYMDSLLASLLPTGAVATLAYCQTIYLLPIGLFGMSISAAELPAMSQIQGHEAELFSALRARLEKGLRQILFFIIPSTVGFVSLGDTIIRAVFETGKFSAADTHYVWQVLAVASIGLISATLARLYSSTYYALKDTRTPLLFSCVRVSFSMLLGIILSLFVPRWLELDRSQGLLGLALASALGAILEFLLLRKHLFKKIGPVSADRRYLLSLFLGSILAAFAARYLNLSLSEIGKFSQAILTLGLYGLFYGLMTLGLAIPEARNLLRRIIRS